MLSEHDFVISGGDAWVTAYKDVPMDLSTFGGPTNGTLSDSAVQEYDLKTGKLVKTWDAFAAHSADAVAVPSRSGAGVAVGRLPHQLDPADGRRVVPDVFP